jgi:hypothetical protein
LVIPPVEKIEKFFDLPKTGAKLDNSDFSAHVRKMIFSRKRGLEFLIFYVELFRVKNDISIITFEIA